jgi:hypothetical protein
MTMSIINNETLSTEHSGWIKALDFYNDDLNVLEKRLLEVSNKNSSQEAREGIEHFQNQFMIQRQNISNLKHEINFHVKEFGNEFTEKAHKQDTELLSKHLVLQEKQEQFEKFMNSLRREFNEFLSKWM